MRTAGEGPDSRTRSKPSTARVPMTDSRAAAAWRATLVARLQVVQQAGYLLGA